MRLLKLATGLAALVALSTATSAQAQTMGYPAGGGYTPGWNGYAPGYGWTGYSPQVFAPPATRPAPLPPQGQPGTVVARPGTRPGPVVQQTVPSVTRQTRPSQTHRPAHYREFGTGRNVFMHKPWLPK